MIDLLLFVFFQCGRISTSEQGGCDEMKISGCESLYQEMEGDRSNIDLSLASSLCVHSMQSEVFGMASRRSDSITCPQESHTP